MLINHTAASLSLLLLCLTTGHLPLVSSRVLVRPSVSTLIPYNTDPTTDQYAPQLLDRSEEQPVPANVSSSSDQIYNDLLSFLATKRLQRRVGRQPAAATDADFATSAAKGCSMLYMLAASADDALTRLKINPNLAGYTSSQSKWDNAGALKQYGWTESKFPMNWAYMGVNDVMKDIGVDTASKDNQNIRLLQDTAVTVDGKDYVVSEISCTT